MTRDDNLADFTVRSVSLLGEVRHVHVSGDGPGVIVMPEMPGISPHVARFARWVRDRGMTVYLPSIFGTDGALGDADSGAQVFRRLCVAKEFRALGGGESSPVTAWLMALARLVHRECGGPGVGAVGMCFTGNFAITMMLESAVVAPVACQPALPVDEPGALEISDAELAAVKERLDRDGLTVLAYRFEGDVVCTRARFDAYAQTLGDSFLSRELPDTAANPEAPPFFAAHVPYPHSVVTVHLIDGEDEPTTAARDEILDFLHDRLHGLGISRINS
ncbi:dienelactone hydrolase family protein [Micromonospora sp. NPDC005189]|uniref:dienelactone hydrolase family protein n=1 Tax=unclassified Micromonospora TaxID=2617518 RepID=UPI0033B321DB